MEPLAANRPRHGSIKYANHAAAENYAMSLKKRALHEFVVAAEARRMPKENAKTDLPLL